MAPNNHQIRNNSLYAKSTREKLLEDPALKKACKIAIKLLRLKTIKKLRRLKETSTLRDKFVDKLQVLRKLKVDSVLKAIDGIVQCLMVVSHELRVNFR